MSRDVFEGTGVFEVEGSTSTSYLRFPVVRTRVAARRRTAGAAEPQGALGIGVSLHEHYREVSYDAFDEGSHSEITPERSFRDTTVGEYHDHIASSTFAKKIGPQLGLENNNDRRLYSIERPTHRELPVEREVKCCVQIGRRPCESLAGQCRRRNHQATGGELSLEPL